MKRLLVTLTTVCAAFPAPQAFAQNNPFLPPSGGGLTKAQVEQIIHQEIERTRVAQKGLGGPSQPGGEDGVKGQMKGGPVPNVAGLPPQTGGRPSANTAAGGVPGQAERDSDPVADLLKDGGVFVGCVADTPIFKDKLGRRAYFTTKELRESNAARRYTRCN